MKTLVFSIFFVLAIVGYSQPYIDMTMSVRDESSEELLDYVWVQLYSGDTLIDTDSSGVMLWGGQGHLKGFWLEYGSVYKLVFTKEGYVTKTAQVDLTNPKLAKNEDEIHLSLFVTLFPDCGAGDYSFMESTPMIKLFLNDDGEQDWDRDHAREMQLKVSAAHYANLSKEQKDKYIKLYYDGQSLIEFQKYDEAMETLLKAQMIVDCYSVQRAIFECQERKDGLYEKEPLEKKAAAYFEAGNYAEAERLYQRLIGMFRDEIDTKVNERLQLVKLINRADKNYRDGALWDAMYMYERVLDLMGEEGNPKTKLGTYAESKRKELEIKLESDE